MTGEAFPVPVWNSTTGTWDPVDTRYGHRMTHWPEGFDAGALPRPEYHDGDHVQFIRDETCAREGVIRRVFLQHAASHAALLARDAAISFPTYEANDVIYIVTARGHDHRITANNILGRFVSPERISRILPLQE